VEYGEPERVRYVTHKKSTSKNRDAKIVKVQKEGKEGEY